MDEVHSAVTLGKEEALVVRVAKSIQLYVLILWKNHVLFIPQVSL